MSDDTAIFFAVVLYFGGALLAAWLADRSGRSKVVYLVGCLLLPVATIPAVIYLALVGLRASPSSEPVSGREGSSGRIGDLERLTRLRASGALSDEEFAAEKTRLLG